MYAIMFNGPPTSGKDSIAQCLRTMLDLETDLPTFTDHFARPMRVTAMTLAGFDPDDFQKYNEIKDEPLEIFNGDSIRQFMIYLSERCMKARYGKDFWGRVLIEQAPYLNVPGIMMIPDLGFDDEGQRTANHFGYDNTLIVRVTRPKIDWGNDSRGYVNLLGVHSFNLLNFWHHCCRCRIAA